MGIALVCMGTGNTDRSPEKKKIGEFPHLAETRTCDQAIRFHSLTEVLNEHFVAAILHTSI